MTVRRSREGGWPVGRHSTRAVLAESLSGAPILLIGTYRPVYRFSWMAKSFATQLALSSLSDEDSLSVVRSVLPDVGPGDLMARVILEKAEGSPFFLEELSRAIAEGGELSTGVTVPDTVHGVLMARIDRLAEQPKRALQPRFCRRFSISRL